MNLEGEVRYHILFITLKCTDKTAQTLNKVSCITSSEQPPNLR